MAKLLNKKLFINKVKLFFGLYLTRNPVMRNVKRWVKDHGDEKLRLDYPLCDSSIVFDVGGYLGDYAELVNRKYGCRVYLFEPVPFFYDECVRKFHGNTQIKCLNYGLSAVSGLFEMYVDGDTSSFEKKSGMCQHKTQLRSITDVVAELGLKEIDLVKINIEGGEYELLPLIISSGLVNNINYLQVQFHDFVVGAADKRWFIRELLRDTHYEMWNYDFVWESWARR